MGANHALSGGRLATSNARNMTGWFSPVDAQIQTLVHEINLWRLLSGRPWIRRVHIQVEAAYAAGGAAPAADPVQHCLDLVQFNLARKISPTFHVTSHPVQNPPKDLPIQ